MINIIKLNDNPYVIGILLVLVFLYSPNTLMVNLDVLTDMFKNDIFRALFLFLLVLIDVKDSPTVSILITMLFIIAMNNVTIKEKWSILGPVGFAGQEHGINSELDLNPNPPYESTARHYRW